MDPIWRRITDRHPSGWEYVLVAYQTIQRWALRAMRAVGPSLLFFLSLVTPVLAGENVWTSNGPSGGSIQALAIDPRNPLNIYAGAYPSGGILKSTNGGDSWVSVKASLGIQALAIDPINPQIVYAGGGGMWKSVDGGASWVSISTGLTSSNVWAIAIDPRNPQVLYVAVFSGGVFKSTNGGSSWTAVNNGLANQTVFALALDGANSQVVYAGTLSGGVFKSTNGGNSWVAINHPNLAGKYVHALAVDPKNAQIVYAGTSEGAVFKSVDGGNSWLQLLSPGALGLYNLYALVVDPVRSPTVYLASGGKGLFKSTDGGTSWSEMNTGLTATNTNAYALAIDPTNPQTVFAAFLGAGVFKSTDGASSWRAVNNGINNTSVRALVAAPRVAGMLYAGTGGGGVFKSRDGGFSWVGTSTGLEGGSFISLAIDPTNPQNLYAGTDNSAKQIFRSMDGGTSWAATNSGEGWQYWVAPRAIAVAPTNPQVLYAGGWMSLYKTTNGGVSWNLSSTGMTLSNVYVSALAIDPANPQVLYAGIGDGGSGGTIPNGGIFKSVDGGNSWRALSTGLPDAGVNALVITPSSSQILYAGLGDSRGRAKGVFKSTDGGTSWFAVSTGLSGSIIRALSIDPTNPQTIYAGGGGVFRSTNGGGSWSAVNTGLTNTDVRALVVDPVNPRTLYAGTEGGGVFSIAFGPALSLYPTSLTVDSTTVGATSQMTIAATNTGTSDLLITGITLSGAEASQFRVSSTTGIVVPGDTKIITVSFMPTSLGTKNASLTIVHNASGSPAVVPLMGKGIQWMAIVSPMTLDFGEVQIGQSQVQVVSVGHSGTAPLLVSDISSRDAQFTVSPKSFSVAVGGEPQTFTVTFKPASTGLQRTTLFIAHNAPNSPTPVEVSGTGVAPTNSPDFDGSGVVDFDDLFLFVPVYGTPESTPGFNPKFDLNSDGRIAALDYLLFAQNFAKTTSEISLTPPTSPGPNSRTNLVVSLDRNSGIRAGEKVRLTVGLTGASGLTGYVAEVFYDDATLENPVTEAVLQGTISPGKTSDASVVMENFNRQVETAGAQLPPKPVNGNLALIAFEFVAKPGFTTAEIGVRRLIVVAGSRIDTIIVSPSPLVMQITSSVAPAFQLSPSSLIMDTTTVGSTSQKSFTVSNTGSANLSITDISVGGVDPSQFTVSPTTATVVSGQSQTFRVGFSPTSAGVRSAVLTITHDAAGSPASVSLAGTGIEPPPPGPIAIDFNPALGDQQQRTAGNALPGKVYTLQLNGEGMPEINGWSVTIKYDQDQVRYVSDSFQPSEFISGLLPLVDDKVGVLGVGGTVLGTQAKNSGKGTMGTLAFEVLERFTGQADLVITEVNFRRLDKVDDKRQVWSMATITREPATEALSGDFDGNNVVGFDDFFLFADAFGGTDPRFDLDGDGAVGFTDFFLFADNFGKEAQAKLMVLARQYIGLPGTPLLKQNFPNPFNPETVISYQLPYPALVRLEIYNLLGQKMRTLVDQMQVGGYYAVVWNSRDNSGQSVSGGVYFYRLETDLFSLTRKLVLLR